MKSFVLLLLSAALTACGTGREASVSQTKTALPAADEFVLACSADESFAATVQSIRVTVQNGAATLVIDRFDGSEVFAAGDSRIVSLNDAALAAAWTQGAAFAATQERGRVFTGSVTLADQSVIGVRCVRIVTSDRDADEFSLVCAPASAATPGAELPDVPASLLLTYEEGELEMFVNPTSAIEIFDLELASDVTVTDGQISGSWEFHATSFRATAAGPDVFSADLNYRGLSDYEFVCHKI